MTFTLTILGSSSALPTSDRYTSAHVLNVHEHLFLIDCGEGTQVRLRQFKLKFSKINHIFISHLHGDHFFGLSGLISSFNILGRKNPLHIYSFPELEEIIHQSLNSGGQELGFQIIFHTLQCNSLKTIYSDKHIEVCSFPLIHRIPTCGFLFKEKPKQRKILKSAIEEYHIPLEKIKEIKEGKGFETTNGTVKNDMLTCPLTPPSSYAYCSDTLYNPEIVPFIKDVTLLYHEATFLEDYTERAKVTFHSTAIQAAKIAEAAHAGKLILGHFSVRYKDMEDFLKEAKTIFKNTELAFDGLQISF